MSSEQENIAAHVVNVAQESATENKNHNQIIHHHHHRNRQPRKEHHIKLWKTPKETMVAAALASEKKVQWAIDKYILLTILAGIYVSIGGCFAIALGRGVPSYDIGIQRLLFALAFPTGLVLIVFLGGELFTGGTMYYTLGSFERILTIKSSLFGLFLSYVGNWGGTHFFAYLFAYLTDIFADEPYLSGVRAIAELKTSLPFYVIFLRGIVANFLVCAALIFASSAEDIASKLLAIWVFISCFAAIGYEHCVANMFFVPLGIWYGADTTYAKFIYKSLIPSTLGNIIGGCFLGFIMWFLYSFHEDVVHTIEIPKKECVGFNLWKWSIFPQKEKELNK